MAVSGEVGIPFAVDAAGHRFGRSAIDRSPQPFRKPLSCAGCKLLVTAVAGYTTGSGRHTSSHYRRHPGVHHDASCPYDFDRQVQVLVGADSTALERERSGHYRLVLPDELQAQPPHDPPGTYRRRRASIVVRRADAPRLSAAINSAVKVARLLERFDHMPQALEAFTVRSGRSAIAWRDFCYLPDRYDELASRLSTDRTRLPVAVSGIAQARGVASAGTSYWLMHDPSQRVQLDGSAAYLRLRIRSRSEAVLERVTDGQRFFALGWCGRLDAGKSRGGHRRCDLNMWINSAAGICSW
ncbi:hypothetical protein [Actinocatenispora comari]|uniref:Uncharacterized protein n=1 Tax=Actinocatenispora comari TaxID=2807577 RepID=A0A8J4AGK3_9ACTN|nr:hypothetical protein [Actinocatenispora comari]GIL29165.1 hypothetical protein NUM_44190 [Actinocatenispora comari]